MFEVRQIISKMRLERKKFGNHCSSAIRN